MSLAPTFDSAVSTVSNLLGGVLGGSVLGWQQAHMGELNPNLFVTFQDKKTGTFVRARIISYSVSNQAEWANKFEGSDADSKVPTISAILQSGIYSDKSDKLSHLAGKTLITKAQSVQVWTGLQPQEVSFELEFRAFTNASQEVEQPIQALIKMMSPQLNNNMLSNASALLAGSFLDEILTTTDKANKIAGSISEKDAKLLGEVPSDISVSFLSKRFNSTYRIESMEESIDEIKIDRQGNRVYQIVSLTLGSTAGIMKSDVNDGSIAGAIGQLGGAFSDALNQF